MLSLKDTVAILQAQVDRLAQVVDGQEQDIGTLIALFREQDQKFGQVVHDLGLSAQAGLLHQKKTEALIEAHNRLAALVNSMARRRGLTDPTAGMGTIPMRPFEA
jgi:hypothetical protein